MPRQQQADRFSRIELLLGPEAVKKLHSAHVVVCGLGAVGSFATESLARSGIGRLRLVDFDVIHPSNINRQLFALESTLGRYKVDVARSRVLDINPDCRAEPMSLFIDEKTAGSVVADADVVIDAIDSVNPKVTLIHAAVAAGVPIVSAMGAATRLDPLAIRVGDISQTEICPLARFIRKKLRKKGVQKGVRCVYSIEPPRNELLPPDEAPDEERVIERGRPRQPLGSMCSLPGMFGLIAAREAIGLILSGLMP
ncbi:MAG: tRNA threonylcarbamoyladenosine dehydratase [Kiritimatiellae bacterium]|nr:tRNA threonylcarbamoyladenosine dehydratase [Kiritimatiellia bacterium]